MKKTYAVSRTLIIVVVIVIVILMGNGVAYALAPTPKSASTSAIQSSSSASSSSLSSSFSPATQAGTGILPIPTTPINHIVIIMQENHAFDNFFGAFPGLNASYAINATACVPFNLTSVTLGCVKPFNADNFSTAFQAVNLVNTWVPAHTAYNNGSMNGFIHAQALANVTHANYSMGYLTGKSIPNYWDYASHYALDANFFSSALSSSYPNHLFTVAAQAGPSCGKTCNLAFNLTFPTIVDELQAKGVSWKFYAGNWNDSLDCSPLNSTILTREVSPQFDPIWSPLLDFPKIQLSHSTCNNDLNTNDLMKNISNGYLPQVAWVMPNGSASDHPGTSTLAAGQLYVTSIINAISSNSALWNSTAIFVTWDDWGGYFDHIIPKQVDSLGYGFRVPLIVISPFVKRGNISYGNPSGAQEDFSAFLSTIEANWGLGNLTARDGADASLFYMFNFTQTPLKPLILPSSTLATYPQNGSG